MNARVFDNIITIPFSIENIENKKQYFQFDPKWLRTVTIRAVSVSYYFTNPGQVNQSYLTFVNNKFETLLYNYPLQDLVDTTETTGLFVQTSRLRLFDLHDISLMDSYVITTDIGIPTPRLNLNLNLYY